MLTLNKNPIYTIIAALAVSGCTEDKKWASSYAPPPTKQIDSTEICSGYRALSVDKTTILVGVAQCLNDSTDLAQNVDADSEANCDTVVSYTNTGAVNTEDQISLLGAIHAKNFSETINSSTRRQQYCTTSSLQIGCIENNSYSFYLPSHNGKGVLPIDVRVGSNDPRTLTSTTYFNILDGDIQYKTVGGAVTSHDDILPQFCVHKIPQNKKVLSVSPAGQRIQIRKIAATGMVGDWYQAAAACKILSENNFSGSDAWHLPGYGGAILVEPFSGSISELKSFGSQIPITSSFHNRGAYRVSYPPIPGTPAFGFELNGFDVGTSHTDSAISLSEYVGLTADGNRNQLRVFEADKVFSANSAGGFMYSATTEVQYSIWGDDLYNAAGVSRIGGRTIGLTGGVWKSNVYNEVICVSE